MSKHVGGHVGGYLGWWQDRGVPAVDDLTPADPRDALDPYDGVLLVSFGGPDGPDDVMPFLEQVAARAAGRRGAAIPRERLVEVAQHYLARGGVSPINAANRRILAELSAELGRRGSARPVFWGNRNWHPTLEEALQQARDAGSRRLVGVLTSAYSSYAGCRQYREEIVAARAAVPGAPAVDVVRPYFNHPGLVAAATAATRQALHLLGAELTAGAQRRVVFVTHSIPTAMADASGTGTGAYLRQHRAVAAAVMAALADEGAVAPGTPGDLAYCSRSGSPRTPWLEPDVADHLATLAGEGVAGVVVVPIGFVSDHMEVVNDLDGDAAAAAGRLGLAFRRAATVGTDARFVAALADLLTEQAVRARGGSVTAAVCGELPAAPWPCPDGCCAPSVVAPAAAPVTARG